MVVAWKQERYISCQNENTNAYTDLCVVDKTMRLLQTPVKVVDGRRKGCKAWVINANMTEKMVVGTANTAG